jgi:hypothetical protein
VECTDRGDDVLGRQPVQVLLCEPQIRHEPNMGGRGGDRPGRVTGADLTENILKFTS